MGAAALVACTDVHSGAPSPVGASSPATAIATGRPGGSSGTPTTVPTTPGAPRPSSTPPVAIPGGVPLRATPCEVTLPQSWQQAIANGRLWSEGPEPQWKAIPAVAGPAGQGVLYQENASESATSARIVLRGAGGEVVRVIGTIPRPNGVGGIGADAADGRRIAFVDQYGPPYDMQDAWTMYVWDARAGRLIAVGKNLTDPRGQPLRGAYVLPVLGPDYLYWIRAAPEVDHITGTGVGSELMQYSFATGRTRALYDGLVDAVVPYGDEVLFTAPVPGARAKDGRFPPLVLHALDQGTGEPAAVPVGLTAGKDDAFQLVTDGDAIAWRPRLNTGIRLWRPEWKRTITIVHGAIDDLQLWGQYLMYSGYGSKATNLARTPKLIDLKTDSLAVLTHLPGRGDLGGHYLGLWQAPVSSPTGLRSRYTAYLVDLSSLPDLPSCPHR